MATTTARFYAVSSYNHVRNLSLLIPCMISQIPATIFTCIRDTTVASTTATITTMASLPLSQAVLQVADSWLDICGLTLRTAGVTEENMLRKKLMMIHSLARTIRMMVREEKRTKVETKIQNISLFGLAFIMVIAMRFIGQTVELMIKNMMGTLKKLLWWIFANKMELSLAVLLMMNAILLWRRI